MNIWDWCDIFKAVSGGGGGDSETEYPNAFRVLQIRSFDRPITISDELFSWVGSLLMTENACPISIEGQPCWHAKQLTSLTYYSSSVFLP